MLQKQRGDTNDLAQSEKYPDLTIVQDNHSNEGYRQKKIKFHVAGSSISRAPIIV
ncbi:MAG: hypothetical protein WBB28_00085 [Crinalium sp.]